MNTKIVSKTTSYNCSEKGQNFAVFSTSQWDSPAHAIFIRICVIEIFSDHKYQVRRGWLESGSNMWLKPDLCSFILPSTNLPYQSVISVIGMMWLRITRIWLLHLIVSKWDPLELVIVHALLVRWVRRVIDMAPRLRTSIVIRILSSDTDYLSA